MPARSLQPEVIPAVAARRLLMHAQGLLGDPARPATPASVYRAIEQMGFVQLDTITVVERAHNHILFSRFDDFRPAILDRLHRDGRLFEHKTHDASLIPSRWYPHWHHRFAKPEWKTWIRSRLGKDADTLLDAVVARVRDHGPIFARDLESSGDAPKSGPWWDWRPEKAALEYLWRTGRLAIASRDNFQKVYDLPENVLGDAHTLPTPSPDDHLDWACTTALDRLGFATHGELAAFWKSIPPARAAAWCRKALSEGRIVPVLVEAEDGSRPRRSYAAPDWRRQVKNLPDPPARSRVINPFDPVIRDRGRCLRLFNFDYRFEAFVPAAKRRHGYYVLPILEHDRLTGRMDAKLHRDTGELQISRLWWEAAANPDRSRRSALGEALDRFAAFLGARSWTLPGEIKGNPRPSGARTDA